MQQREIQLLAWLHNVCRLRRFTFAVASEDASFRRYFRVSCPGQPSLVVMDAPPAQEDCTPFVAMAERLGATGVHVPNILKQDLTQGFLLLEDLGTHCYLDQLNAETADALYGAAITAILRIQSAGVTTGLVSYTADLLHQEMQLFIDWYLVRYLGLQLTVAEQCMLHDCFALLVENALHQPQVLVHRDFHARNLLCCPEDAPGIIDFQDAVYGPMTYDLVSLLRDSYIQWPPQRVALWRDQYTAQALRQGLLTSAQSDQMPRWFDWMGVQRHLKIAGIFARLHLRDGKSGYLADIPQTLHYLQTVAHQWPELQALAYFVQHRVIEQMT